MPEIGNSSVFSQTDASNASGTMPSWSGSAAPSTLDDAGRAFQGAVTREWNWRNFTLTAAGTADAKTLTYSVAPAAYYNGQRFGFIANTTNTTSCTLNVNALGAKTIKSMLTGSLANLAASDMVSGMYVEVAYNLANDCFVWINQKSTLTLPQSLGTSDSPQFAGVNVGAATDTTITRVSAGVIAVEGNTIVAPASPAQGDVIYYNGTAWVRLAAGTSGQYLQTLGTGANPAWAAVNTGMTLLSTLTTTSGSTATASGLTLTSYKKLYFTFSGVSFTTNGRVLSVDSQIVSPGSVLSTNSIAGFGEIDLNTGIIIANSADSSTPSTIQAFSSVTTYSTATTSVVFGASGTFDAGTIKLYGVA